MKSLSTHGYKAEVKLFRAIAHPVRYGIVFLLLEGEQNVSELQQQLKLRQPLISQHLMILRKAGVVARRKHQRHCWYSLLHQGVYKKTIEHQ